MVVRTILRAGLLSLLCAVIGWAQTPPANAGPCTPQPQQQAAATPPAAVETGNPQQSGAPPPLPYQPLSRRQKFNVFVQHTYSPYTFAGAAFGAGLAQATGAWHSYGGGMEGYGKRFGASLADSESGALFGRFLFPVLLHEDPRYLRSTSKGPMPRIGYALSRVLVTRDDHGNRRTNLSLILSVFASSGLGNTYYPRDERGLGDTAVRAGNGFLSTAGMNVLREFWPDIKQKFKKHEPKRVHKLEESPRVNKIERIVIGPTVPPPCPPPESHPEQTGNR
jgi:hypothetical protein